MLRSPLFRSLPRLGRLALLLAALGVIGVLASRAGAAPALPDGDAAGLVPATAEAARWSMLLLNGAVLLLGVSWVVLMLRRRG